MNDENRLSKKESQKSEIDVNSENPSDFGFDKNCRIPTTFELRHNPVYWECIF